jgi:NADH-quinone oxidoreductase subunit N
MTNLESFAYFIPELILSMTVLVVLIASVFGVDRERFDWSGLLALAGTLAALVAITGLFNQTSPVMLFQGMLAHDMFALFFRVFFLLSTAVVIVMTMFSREVLYRRKSEYHAILLAICVGMCLVAGSQDMLMIYLSLELMSLGSYLLVGFARKVGKSEEASLKYVLYGSVSTGIMLFGLSLLYGLTGTTSFAGIREALAASSGQIDLVMYVIFLFILVGAGYKIAAVPFHFWAPDVYEGAPTPITAYLSVASKATGFALLIRFFYSTILAQAVPGGPWVEIADIDINWTLHIALLSALTMTIGNLGAIPQTNLKRLLAYSGIAHAGYLLMGVAVMTTVGVESVIFYLVMYLFTNLAAFLVIVIVVEAQDNDRISGMRGLWERAPYSALMMAVALFSLVGLPPTAGFVGKVYLLYAVLQGKLYWLALAAVLNTVVSLYYYARIVRAMFLEDAAEKRVFRIQPVYAVLLCVLTVPVVYFGIWWDPLVKLAKTCAVMIP